MGKFKLGIGTAAVSAGVAGAVVAGGFGCPAATAQASTGARPTVSCLTPPASCYAPHQFRAAYGIEPLTDRGIDGRGQTIVFVELASQPPASPPAVTDIRQDLARFDGVFGLPAAKLSVVTKLGGSAAPWLATPEEVEDLEVAHAVAPDAALRIVLVPPTATSSVANFATALTDAVRTGVSEGSVISISASIGEHYLTPAQVSSLNAALQEARQ